MEKFLFNNNKVVVVSNVNSITKRNPGNLGNTVVMSYYIDILYVSGVIEHVSYGSLGSIRDIDFNSFLFQESK